MMNLIHMSCAWIVLLGSASGHSDVKTDESVIFFPTLGWRTAEGDWECLIHGWVYEEGVTPTTLGALRQSLGLGGDSDDGNKELFGRRAAWFLTDNEGDKHIVVRLKDRNYPMPPSDGDGHFMRHIDVAGNAIAGLHTTAKGAAFRIDYRVAMPPDDARVFEGATYLLEPRGLSVISDIDDTIKVTNVQDTDEMLKNTFVRPYRAVPGMAYVYQAWASRYGAVFHYVSASPWQLYPSLRPFLREAGFPDGSMHLKRLEVSLGSLHKAFESPLTYKLEQIEPILARFPQRRFVLVGDSTERDPEAYAKLASKYPHQVAGILIRAVKPDRVDSPRFARVFEGLPAEMWRVFDSASKIRELPFMKED